MNMSTELKLNPRKQKRLAFALASFLFAYAFLPPLSPAQPPAHSNPAPPQFTNQSSPSSSVVTPVIKDVRFRSPSLAREMPYRIYLPHNYASTTERYPVLYLLHGLFGSFENWDKLTHLSTYAAGMNWIIVMPEADNSWYSNSATVPQDKFEDYIAIDLIAEIDANYRTISTRRARAIAGLSMGGYAAMKLALRDPQLFFFAASLSGALDAARNLDTRLPEFAPRLREVFGAAQNPARAQNDVYALLPKAASQATLADLPYLYLACGEEDRFLPVNREFVADLSERHVPYEYHEMPGTHDWIFWDREINPLLAVMQKKFSASGM